MYYKRSKPNTLGKIVDNPEIIKDPFKKKVVVNMCRNVLNIQNCCNRYFQSENLLGPVISDRPSHTTPMKQITELTVILVIVAVLIGIFISCFFSSEKYGLGIWK